MRLIISIILISVVLISCKKDFDAINTNPNEPTTADADYLFTNAQIKGGGQFSTGTHSNIWTMMVWSQSMADVNGIFSSSSPYTYGNDWNDELWKEWYADVLSITNQVIKVTEDDPFLINKHSIARIWKVFIMHRITDLWGDVPYSEALQGENESGEPILQPAYDPQDLIYADLLAELQEATLAIDPSKDNFFSADVIYQGDTDKWIRFANSLRLRLALRIINADPTLAEAHISALMNEDVFINSNTESAEIVYNGLVRSPFFELSNSGQGMLNPSHFFVELLKNTNDPRISTYLEPTASSAIFGTDPYVGVPNLMTSTELNTNDISEFTTSAVGSTFLTEDAPVVIMSNAEVQFLKAEAAYRGYSGSGSMQSFYEAGVTSAMDELAIPSDSITTFLAGAGAFDGTLEQVITQKWITFVYKDGFEAFAEVRRTGYPQLTDFNNNLIDQTQFPKRLSYPLSEQTLNGTNVTAVGVGINDFLSPVWWDL